MKEDSQIIQYQTQDGGEILEVNLQQETVWLSLNQMVSLFDRDKSVISRHIRNVFKEGELEGEGKQLLQILQQFKSKVNVKSFGTLNTTTSTSSSPSATG